MAKVENGKTAGAKAAQQVKKRKTAAIKTDAPIKRSKKEGSIVSKPSAAAISDKTDAIATTPQKERKRKRQEGTEKAIKKWEAIRRHDTDPKQRASLVSEVLKENAGSLQRLAASPVGSRVLQSCVKHGTAAQRKQILQELQSQMQELSKSPYAYHVVCKLVDTAAKADLEVFMKAFKGQVVRMLRHPCASRVVNELYTAASTKQRRTLTAEFYGREAMLFHEEAPQGLQEVLGRADATRKLRLVQQMAINVIPIIEKGLLDPVITHGLVKEYMDALPATGVIDVVEMLSGPAIMHVVHSHAGADVACRVLALGTAKQRKKVIKAMKGHVKVMAEDEWAHIVLIAALSFTDDTALLRKTIVPELLAAKEALCSHKTARHIALHLLAPGTKRYLPAHAAAMLTPAANSAPAVADVPVSAASDSKPAVEEEEEDDGDMEAKDEGSAARVGGSKKDPTVRRREILGQGPESLGHALTEAATASAASLLQSMLGSDVLVEVACGGEAGVLAELDAEGVAAVQHAIVEAAKVPAPDGKPGQALLEHFVASRALRRLLLRGKGGGLDAAQAQAFAELLWTGCLSDCCKQLVDGHAAKVLAAVYSCGAEEVKAGVESKLSPLLPEGTSPQAWAAGLADKEHLKIGKPVAGLMQKQDAPAK